MSYFFGKNESFFSVLSCGPVLRSCRAVLEDVFINPFHLKFTLVHELGHALGLRHVGEPDSIMYSRRSEKFNERLPTYFLSDSDIKRIQTLYGNGTLKAELASWQKLDADQNLDAPKKIVPVSESFRQKMTKFKKEHPYFWNFLLILRALIFLFLWIWLIYRIVKIKTKTASY